jgi:hypothetical protein
MTLKMGFAHDFSAYPESEHLGCIRKLLEKYQQLGCVELNPHNSLPFHEMHLMRFNKCGRVLLRYDDTVSKSIPLSVWPTVLARVRLVTQEKYKNKNIPASYQK